MPRFLAFADSQLGVATVDLADQAAVLERIVGVALDHEVDAVLHGGDVFEGPLVTPEQLRVFIDATRPLRDEGVPLLVIRGNGRHDSAVRSVHALDIFREIDGITVHDRPGIFHVDGVAVCTLPWVHPGRLIATIDDDISRDDVNAVTATLLVEAARDLREKARPAPAILLAHWAITGSALPSGLPVEEMREPVLPWAELDALGYDLIVGAHIHQGQRLGDPEVDQTRGIVLGSPQQLSHGEKGDHGCWRIDVSPWASAEFIPIESRRFVTLDAVLGADGTVEIGGGPGDNALGGAVVRIRYSATEDQARRVDHTALRRQAVEAGASRVTIEPTVVREARARAEAIDEQLGPVDALATYCDAQAVEDPLRGRMLDALRGWIEAA